MPGTVPSPGGQPLKVVSVEKAGDEAWAGVAAIDRGEETASTSKLALLAAGDLVAILAFAAVGRINHGGVADLETIYTALPFLAGWFLTSPFLGGFGPSANGTGTKDAALTAAKCWAVGTPLGLVIRGVSKGYVPPTPFIVVSMVTTGVLLIGWRSAYAAASPKAPPKSLASQLNQRKNKQGGPFEFLQLLVSLVKRW
ncbi:hypothetical protein CEUSTIGMA_g1080.t1 [Chlamydomonas eustigma]|uniref:DUF3054 domain-containing protein n=1 Tax=Chlamydomonas eustigma TaxID=1157962 RepID=A0A250WSF9_9CHLO|nr:hypothetical protein CEUSTIGMA_g1080.t1 [Chlamydomonas eustigma]|eukprot:GAX73629.1 hypothetical protein CEUSTIGMA_g1080.t1 [Chlamydomonas eustigma]